MRIAIVGGGIAGLAAAYELEKARAAGAQVDYALFEERARLGGSLASEIVDGAVLERGPDSFLTEKPAAAELCRELGLGGELLPSNDAARKTYIVVRNRLVALPDGLMFLVPTKLIPTALTRLFGLRTKVRMGLELLRGSRPSGGDESVAALVRRHFGQEAVDRLADPLLSGIYGGDAEQLSAQTVLPRLVEMETKYGSLTRGMLAAHKRMRDAAKSSTGPKREMPAIFTALRGGMSQLVDAIVARLDAASLRTGTLVSAIRRVTAGGWSVEAGGATEIFDALIMAAPAWAAGELLGPVDAALGSELGGIPYSSSITLNLVYDEKKIGQLPEGFGFLVPAVEGRAMLACTFVHRKFLGRTPPGKAVFRAFLGGMNREALLAESDEALVETVRREMAAILGAKTFSADVEPEHAQVSRWRRAMAQYAVGHKERMLRTAARVAELPGLRLVGNAYDGIGVPDCIRLGRQAARELVGTGAKMSPAKI
ncbi:MAG: protoporphyrinogen oxidase [Terracidiphilus sp.]|jgi:oxygen-dependent protoporphyrinogen oxidase